MGFWVQKLAMFSYVKGTSINDVSSNFGFLDPLLPPVAPVLALKIAPNLNFWYPHPSSLEEISFMDGPKRDVLVLWELLEIMKATMALERSQMAQQLLSFIFCNICRFLIFYSL